MINLSVGFIYFKDKLKHPRKLRKKKQKQKTMYLVRSLPPALPVLEGICSRMSFTLGASFLEEQPRKGPSIGIQLDPPPPDPQHWGLALAAPAPWGPHLPVVTVLDTLGSCNSLGTPHSQAATSEGTSEHRELQSLSSESSALRLRDAITGLIVPSASSPKYVKS